MVRKRIALTALVALLSSFSVLISAQAATSQKALTAPVITYSGNGYGFKATPAKWSDNGPSSFKWLLDGKTIAGAKSLTTKVATSKAGATIKFSETHIFDDGTSATSVSNSLKVGKIALSEQIVIRLKPENDKIVEISTLPQSIPTTAKPTYQWFLGYFEIKGANKDFYNLKTSDIGADISVQVTFTAKGHTSSKQTSNIVSVAALDRTYKQIWSEDFNGAAGSPADPSVWTPQNGDGVAFGNRGWGNNER